MLPEQERIQLGWETCIIQEAALLPGSAVLAVLISWRQMYHCVWVPCWDVPLRQLPQHAQEKANLNLWPCSWLVLCWENSPA